MKLEGQTRDQRQGDFKNNFHIIVVVACSSLLHESIFLPINQRVVLFYMNQSFYL
jgi:hypothetical protein